MKFKIWSLYDEPDILSISAAISAKLSKNKFDNFTDFAIEQKSNLRVHVESLSSETSRLTSQIGNLTSEVNSLKAESSRREQEKQLSVYRNKTEILIADAISKVYQKMWKII